MNIRQKKKLLRRGIEGSTEGGQRMNKCGVCEFHTDVFGNFIQCVKTGRLVDYEYWNNIEPKDCPMRLFRQEPKEE